MNWSERPAPGEFNEYYETYVSKVPPGNLLEVLASERDRTASLLRGLTDEQAAYRYEPEKWSIKEVVGHLMDTERVFAVRALCFARRDPAELPPFEQDDWAAVSRVHGRPMQEIADEFELVRNSNLALFETFSDEEGLRRGTASGFEFTVRAFPFIICGHEIHHVGVIRDRYLS